MPDDTDKVDDTECEHPMFHYGVCMNCGWTHDDELERPYNYHRRYDVVFDGSPDLAAGPAGLAKKLIAIEMSDLCVEHPDEQNCLYCFDAYGRQTCHHRDHEDFCPFDGPEFR